MAILTSVRSKALAFARQTTIVGWKIRSGQSPDGMFGTIQEDEDGFISVRGMHDGRFVLAVMSVDWQWTVRQRARSPWR
jgi:hypothetical protein